NKVLLVSNIPPEVTPLMLRALFGQFAGLLDVRPVADRGLAFVEFDSESSSLPALQGLHNFRVTSTHALSVAFAK
ncbi:MAG: hypothetical protein EOO65_05795, partial [Methanosarcinales archaeon]